MTGNCSPHAGALCRAALLVAAVGILAACASGSTRWDKVGSTEESVDFDISECQFYAQAASFAESAQSTDTYIGVDSSGQITTTQLPGADSFRFMRQADAFDRCMVSRGYREVAR